MEHEIIQFFERHQVMVTLILYWFFSAIVSGMPSPKADSSLGYQWAFGALHTMAGAVGRVMAAKFPRLADGGSDSAPTPAPPPKEQ